MNDSQKYLDFKTECKCARLFSPPSAVRTCKQEEWKSHTWGFPVKIMLLPHCIGMAKNDHSTLVRRVLAIGPWVTQGSSKVVGPQPG